MTSAAARPRDVVFAAVMTILGSAMALIGIFSTQGQLGSSQVRREVETLLGDEQFSAVDVSVETVLNLVEVGLMVAAAASVAAIVFAVFVMRRHNASRIALTVLGAAAALLVLASGLTGVFIAIFLAYTVSLLWRPQVRAWFATTSGSDTGSEPEPPTEQPTEPPTEQPTEQPTEPPTEPPTGQPTYPDGGQRPGPYPYPYGYPPAQEQGYGYPQAYYGPPPQVGPDRRPGSVVTAHVLTWVGTAFGLITGAFFVVAASSPEIMDVVMEQMPSTGVDADELATQLRVAGALTALWSVAVLVVSVFSWRRLNWAAVTVTVMGAAYMLLQVFALLMGQLAVLVTIVWVAIVVVLLWLPASRQWYTSASRPGPPPGPPSGSPPDYPPYPPPEQPRRNQPW
ncbi:MAG: hypothetical protein ACRDOJ_09060 [Nocardioidaceae bacterium]